MSYEVDKKLINFKEAFHTLNKDCESVVKNVINEKEYKDELIEKLIEIKNKLSIIELELKRIL